ncbi:hypothetical protein [Horticoccus sp. 23ND18S-11]|uniref:hypothetical protein n=1 Tax=Horticoccus sp. 23ND18S-11 TaxID=3391832 RepID=UPI0039C93B4E
MKNILIGGGAAGLIVGGVLLAAGLAKVGERPAKLTWRDPEVKSALMTFGYKVYASPKVQFGRHYLSKLVFKNEGEHPITNFSISYKIDDYVPWTEPSVINQIPGGFTFTELYYPKLPASVSKIRNATNASLQVRYRWTEEGKAREETFSRDITLRGVNELAYCDLPQAEVQSWFDAFNASAFSMAMVTPNDPVVHLYTSEITKQAGGTTAGIAGGAQEVARLCANTYNYMVRSGLRYTGDAGVPTNYDNISTMVQNVRLPRDVIINNQGLCIELTLLWASVLEHLGVRTAMILVPGHAFVLAYSPEQNMPMSQGIAIECTAITPRAVGRESDVSFQDAVKMASETLQRSQQDGRIMILPVQDIQAMGFTPPELSDVDTDKLGETLAKRISRGNPGGQTLVVMQPQGGGSVPAPMPAPAPVIPPGFAPWRHPQGHVSVAFPADFVQLAPSGSFGIVVLSVGNPATSAEVDVMQVAGTQNLQQAINHVTGVFGQMGSRVQVTGSSPGENGAMYFNGMTTSASGVARWVCVAKAVPGGVVLVSTGANSNVWNSQSAMLQTILSTVRFN